MKALAALAGGFVLAFGFASAQTTAPEPSFVVASITPAPPPFSGAGSAQGGPGTADPAHVQYRSVTLRFLFQSAYAMEADRIDGPEWLDSDHYDFRAQVPEGATADQFREMLQKFLAERFRFASHREQKDFAVYRLRVSEAGSKLVPSGPRDDAPPPRAFPAPGVPVDERGFPLPPAHKTAQRTVNGVAQMTGAQITTAQLADFLRFPLSFVNGRGNGQITARVVDQTGLDGEYDVHLQYQWPLGFGAPPGTLSIMDAVQQQLGLTIEIDKEPLEVLVIDRIERTPGQSETF